MQLLTENWLLRYRLYQQRMANQGVSGEIGVSGDLGSWPVHPNCIGRFIEVEEKDGTLHLKAVLERQ